MLSLQEFLRELLMTLPGKELGENVVEFQKFLRDIKLDNIVSINKNGEPTINSAEISSLNLTEVVRKILNYLGGQMEPSLSSLYARLFIDAYEEIKSSSKPAADIWLGQIMRDHGGLLSAYGITNKFSHDVELPSVVRLLEPGSSYFWKKKNQPRATRWLKKRQDMDSKLFV